MKLGRCIKELERIYGIEHGNNQFDRTPKVSESLNQEQLAEMIGISVDTLNNYKKLTELIPELDELVSTGILGDDAEEIDAMDWMLTHQLSSKNLSVGEKLAMTEEFKKEVALENEKKKKQGNKLGADITNNKTVSLQSEAKRNRETNTDRQIAKKAGVGVGTVARYTIGYLYMNLY